MSNGASETMPNSNKSSNRAVAVTESLPSLLPTEAYRSGAEG